MSSPAGLGGGPGVANAVPLALLLSRFSIGLHAVFHSSVCIAATYLVLRTLGGSRATAVGLFVFNLGYLFAGYLMDASSGYDITWTMPQCVLCLRLIGLGFDLWDGTKPKESWSKDQVKEQRRLEAFTKWH